ncbi:MAG: hypothetical protein Q8L86_17920 [Vicinamibacterales bacterium]|nr:hypothetical protein [Vicinamibacterales bacterium]
MPGARLAAVAVLLVLAGGGAGWADAPLRILFVGNSLTYTNDLPLMVESMPCVAGRPVQVGSAAGPDMAISDHLSRGPARQFLREPWDFVVMQQGPSSLPESRTALLRGARRLAAQARRAGAEPALYMVWPSRQREADFDRVSESYRLAAVDVKGVLLPVGEAWRAAWRRDPEIALYGPDGFHPSLMGTYLGALVICSRLGGAAPEDLPSYVRVSGGLVQIPPVQAGILKAAAAEALERFPARD